MSMAVRHAEIDDLEAEVEAGIEAQSERFERFKKRLIARGLSEAEAEEEASSWIRTNAIFDALETRQ